LSKKNKIPKYLQELINKYPHIKSGRKNFDIHQARIIETLKLIRKYFKNYS
tara:strand:- start:175 stop:327 length:153 start_codon:yes stop_codon:yes gene_type:complete